MNQHTTTTTRTRIYLTDGDTDTLHQLRANVAANSTTIDDLAAATTETKQIKAYQKQHHEISCHQLLWGKESTHRFCERHDLACDKSGGASIDLVLGSDLIYVPHVIESLFETVCVLLEQSDDLKKEDNAEMESTTNKRPAMFNMAHNDRREGSSVTLSDVLDGAKKAGVQIDILQEDSVEGIYIIGFTKTSY
jgi:hypothetical protein